MLYKTFKKAKDLLHQLDGKPEAEGKLIALIMLYLLEGKNLELDEFGAMLPEIYNATMRDYGVIYKHEGLRRRK